MRNKLLVLAILLSVHYTCTLAVSAYPYPINITQPDGSKITILLKGDEHFNYAQTTDGFIIAQNIKGIYEYVDTDATNEIKLSGVKANNKGERNIKETQYVQALNKQRILERLLTKQSNIVSRQQSSQIANLMSKTTTTPITGNRKILCILIGFQDRAFSKTQTEFNNLMNQVGYNAGTAVGSVKDFYLENSYNQLNLDVTVVGPYTADYNMAYYGANNIDGGDMRPRELILEALQKANPDVNYADYDNDGDGKVDGVHVIFAGYDEAASGYSSAIWSHRWAIPATTLDGTTITDYSCSSELRSNAGNTISGIGTACHEMGHVFGAADFYDTNYNIIGDGLYTGTGQWDLMGSGNWNGNSDRPAHFNPYTKSQTFQWATVQTISSNQQITLYPANSNANSFYRINTFSPNEYFLVENRQKIGFDTGLPGDGMLVYHVHSLFNGNSQINNVTHPQRFYPICASATQNPNSTSSSYGSINSAGCPFPGLSNKTSLTKQTIPGLISWVSDGTGFDLLSISKNGNNITFNAAIYYTISGPSQICNQATYTIDNLPAGATVSWSYSINLRSVSTGTDYIILQPFKKTGYGTVSATVTIGSSSITLPQLNLWVGKPNQPTGITFLPATPCLNQEVTALVAANNPAESNAYYEWSGVSNIIESNWNASEIHFMTLTKLPYTTYVSATACNECGCSLPYTKLLSVNDCGGNPPVPVVIYPNPASDLLTIDLGVDDEHLFRATKTYLCNIKLWHERQGLVRTVESSERVTNISLQGLPKGMYIVHIQKEGEAVQKQMLWVR